MNIAANIVGSIATNEAVSCPKATVASWVSVAEPFPVSCLLFAVRGRDLDQPFMQDA